MASRIGMSGAAAAVATVLAGAGGSAAQAQAPTVAPMQPGAPLFVLEVVSADAARTRQRLAQLPTGAADVRSATRIPAGGAATPFVFIKACRTGPAGACRVTATFTLTGPAGFHRAPVQAVIWTGAPPAPNTYALGRHAPSFRLSRGDPPGEYRLAVNATDAVAGTSFDTSSPFAYR